MEHLQKARRYFWSLIILAPLWGFCWQPAGLLTNEPTAALLVALGQTITWMTDMLAGHHPEVLVFISVGVPLLMGVLGIALLPLVLFVCWFSAALDEWLHRSGYQNRPDEYPLMALAYMTPRLALVWFAWAATASVAIVTGTNSIIGFATVLCALCVGGFMVSMWHKFIRYAPST